jgi:hypothetical protein
MCQKNNTHMKTKKTLFAACALLTAPALHATLVISDLVQQFDSYNNPSSTGWSYGYENSPGGTFNLLTQAGWNYYDTGYMGWTVSPTTRYPEVNRNSTGVEFCPLSGSALVGARWTSPSFGIAAVDVTFTGYWIASVDTGYNYTIAGGYVLKNGAQSFEGDIKNNNGPATINYQGSLNVSPGDTIDFLVGPHST